MGGPGSGNHLRYGARSTTDDYRALDVRHWVCPTLCCGRRVALLYGGRIFACRHCHQPAYESSREDAGLRALRRAEPIRARRGWEPGILNGHGDKPRWMRWRTCYRLRAEHERLVMRSLHAVALKFGLLGRDLP